MCWICRPSYVCKRDLQEKGARTEKGRMCSPPRAAGFRLRVHAIRQRFDEELLAVLQAALLLLLGPRPVPSPSSPSAPLFPSTTFAGTALYAMANSAAISR